MSNEKFPRSDRTMHPREFRPPLTARRFKEAKASELRRKVYDPHYITRDEVAALPQEALAAPEVRNRIEYSRHDWPENRAVASIALGPLAPGEGETVEQRAVPVEAVLGGKIEG